MPDYKYNEQVDIENIKKLRTMLSELPAFFKDFFRGIEPRTQSRTQIAYAYDIKIFLQFLLEENPSIKKSYKSVTEIPISVLESLTVTDIEEYMEYLKYRDTDGKKISNKENAIKRKISTLKSVFKYFYRTEKLRENIMERVQLPKLHSKEIIRLDIDEVAMMIDEAERGEGLSDRQRAYHGKTKIRDVALLSLLLGTGIRVSECVGLDISDVDFKNNGILIHRKGGKEVTIYFSDEVKEALQNYYDERVLILEESGHEGAFFLSMQNKRLSVRSVENLVKKYAKIISPLKKITPHKLRSTYGTNLYKETGDIYLVADVLGHSDVNTTKKHYAAIEDDRRRSARNVVKLREK
ncbi:site-specific recombinase, phage integrase family [Lachnoanaerobaculum sp. MSX33]|jgi:putative tyrosine recombinase xerC|uniref:tyrosine-type recombinase/integrase n=1 Tax=Lachnoanaerobaculum sp. MSX33 TaxID=936596 RepID=UPI0003DF9BB2|nr:tyrosine-type recombinase/integrase [Lachnoanaerobaculum sp. MSX33]ETO98688.1 site-specific recombinase, phage integrase family [Lachnoanaerobaculum sp. MSX33]